MRMIKIKSICTIIMITLTMLLLQGVVTAYEPLNTEKADKLKAVALFLGTDNGYELDKNFTRAEGAIMVLRLFGLEKAAEQANMKSPFQDVNDNFWASKYIAYAYDKGMVHGTGEGEYTPDRGMSVKEFTTLVLRCLGYGEAAPETALSLAKSTELLTTFEVNELENKEDFLRDDMVQIAFKATQTRIKGTSKTLIQKLVEDSAVVTEKDAVASGLYNKSSFMDEIERAVSEKIE